MSKRFLVIVIASFAALLVLFAVIGFLSLPLGNNGSVLPINALYITGDVTALVFLAAAIFFLVRRLSGLTKGNKRVYDNKNINSKEEGNAGKRHV